MARAIAKRPGVLLCDEPTGRPGADRADAGVRTMRTRSLEQSQMVFAGLGFLRRPLVE
jgi:ABC-type lipoprotein export system ATPase subunit